MARAATTPAQVVAGYYTYQDAQHAVDLLSDSQFPVEQAVIVGRDLRLVERITGRLTLTRVTLMGAASGGWWGLFAAALVGLFLPVPEWLGVIAAGVLLGSAAGGLFGLFAHLATSGRRDFTPRTPW